MRISIENKARLAFAVLLLVGRCCGTRLVFVASSRYVTYEVRTRDAVSGLIADAPSNSVASRSAGWSVSR